VGLDRGDLDLAPRLVRLFGKGKRSAWARLGPQAVAALQAYLAHPQRPQPTPRARQAVFLTRAADG